VSRVFVAGSDTFRVDTVAVGMAVVDTVVEAFAENDMIVVDTGCA
jgi:hypothetical protein